MAVETISAGQLVAIADLIDHEYEIDDLAYRADLGPQRRTINIEVKSGTIKFAVGKVVPGSHNGYVATEKLVLDIVRGVANLHVLGTNPCSFVIT